MLILASSGLEASLVTPRSSILRTWTWLNVAASCHS